VERYSKASLNRYRTVLQEEFDEIQKLLSEVLVKAATNAAPGSGDLDELDSLETSLDRMTQAACQ
jgi:hypothetical protein